MKILFLADDFPPASIGGAGVIAQSLAMGMSRMGHTVSIITTTQEPGEEGQTVQNGLNIFRIYSKYHSRWRAYLSIYNPQTVKKIEAIIAQLKPEVVHAHHIHQYLSYQSLRSARKHSRRVIMTMHDTMCYSYGKVLNESKRSSLRDLVRYRFRFNPLRNTMIRHYIHKYVDVVVAVSESLQRAIKNNGIKDVSVIHNGIDVESWSVSADDVRKFIEYRGLSGKKKILYGGRLSGAKGGDKIVRSMNAILQKVPNAILMIAGLEKGYASFMKETAMGQQIWDKLVFLGWLTRDEMKLAYHACEIAVVPSLYLDPFPTVNLEAMAAGKAVVGTCFGGSPEIIANNSTGFIVNPNNSEELVAKICELLIDDKYVEFGKRGHERVKKYFSLQGQTERYLRIYTA